MASDRPCRPPREGRDDYHLLRALLQLRQDDARFQADRDVRLRADRDVRRYIIRITPAKRSEKAARLLADRDVRLYIVRITPTKASPAC